MNKTPTSHRTLAVLLLWSLSTPSVSSNALLGTSVKLHSVTAFHPTQMGADALSERPLAMGNVSRLAGQSSLSFGSEALRLGFIGPAMPERRSNDPFKVSARAAILDKMRWHASYQKEARSLQRHWSDASKESGTRLVDALIRLGDTLATNTNPRDRSQLSAEQQISLRRAASLYLLVLDIVLSGRLPKGVAVLKNGSDEMGRNLYLDVPTPLGQARTSLRFQGGDQAPYLGFTAYAKDAEGAKTGLAKIRLGVDQRGDIGVHFDVQLIRDKSEPVIDVIHHHLVSAWGEGRHPLTLAAFGQWVEALEKRSRRLVPEKDALPLADENKAGILLGMLLRYLLSIRSLTQGWDSHRPDPKAESVKSAVEKLEAFWRREADQAIFSGVDRMEMLKVLRGLYARGVRFPPQIALGIQKPAIVVSPWQWGTHVTNECLNIRSGMPILLRLTRDEILSLMKTQELVLPEAPSGPLDRAA